MEVLSVESPEAAELRVELEANRAVAAAQVDALRVAHVRRGRVQEALTQLRLINPAHLDENGHSRINAALRNLEAALT